MAVTNGLIIIQHGIFPCHNLGSHWNDCTSVKVFFQFCPTLILYLKPGCLLSMGCFEFVRALFNIVALMVCVFFVIIYGLFVDQVFCLVVFAGSQSIEFSIPMFLFFCCSQYMCSSVDLAFICCRRRDL
jgi:hypothetical protein